jgi:hypothetical protein
MDSGSSPSKRRNLALSVSNRRIFVVAVVVVVVVVVNVVVGVVNGVVEEVNSDTRWSRTVSLSWLLIK